MPMPQLAFINIDQFRTSSRKHDKLNCVIACVLEDIERKPIHWGYIVNVGLSGGSVILSAVQNRLLSGFPKARGTEIWKCSA